MGAERLGSEGGAADKGWCVLELMGHRKLAGYVTDDEGMVRIDVYLQAPDEDEHGNTPGPIATQWYGRAAIYCITATTRENCLALTRSHQPQPIGRWELPAPEPDDEPDREMLDAQVEYDSPGSGY